MLLTLLATDQPNKPAAVFCCLWLATCAFLAIVFFTRWVGYRRFPMIDGGFVCMTDGRGSWPSVAHCFYYINSVKDSLDAAEDPSLRGTRIIPLTDGATVIVRSGNGEVPTDQASRHYLRVARQLVEMSTRHDEDRDAADRSSSQSQDAFATTIESITADDDSAPLSV